MVRIGIDVGGTNLVAGVVNDNYEIIARAKVRASDFRTGEEMTLGLVSIAREAVRLAGLEEDQVRSVGIGIPGTVDQRTGVAIKTVNAPFDHTPVREIFQSRWNVPVLLNNDACCAVLGEGLAGCGQESSFFMMFTLGTGVGGSYLKRSSHGIQVRGTEIGHMVIRAGGQLCSCGRRGCWEQYSSATALKRQTREAMEQAPDSLMWTIGGGKVSGRTSFMAKRAGDRAAAELVERYLSDLADGLANAINIFSPELICLGGGVANEREEDLQYPLEKLVAQRTRFRQGIQSTRFVKARLGNDAGIVGAALLDLAEN
ncbi:MAG: ROK family protein [Oscillospiraceae bacterium]|nr:ROK family protein [Oscillospiraceae bacterium]